jgi:hypothetical protein
MTSNDSEMTIYRKHDCTFLFYIHELYYVRHNITCRTNEEGSTFPSFGASYANPHRMARLGAAGMAIYACCRPETVMYGTRPNRDSGLRDCKCNDLFSPHQTSNEQPDVVHLCATTLENPTRKKTAAAFNALVCRVLHV